MKQTSVDTGTQTANDILASIMNGEPIKLTPEVMQVCMATMTQFVQENSIPQDKLEEIRKASKGDETSFECLKNYHISLNNVSPAANAISTIEILGLELQEIYTAQGLSLEQLPFIEMVKNIGGTSEPVQTDMYPEEPEAPKKRAKNKVLEIVLNGKRHLKSTAINTYKSALIAIGLQAIWALPNFPAAKKPIVTKDSDIAASTEAYSLDADSGLYILAPTNVEDKVAVLAYLTQQLSLNLFTKVT